MLTWGQSVIAWTAIPSALGTRTAKGVGGLALHISVPFACSPISETLEWIQLEHVLMFVLFENLSLSPFKIVGLGLQVIAG